MRWHARPQHPRKSREGRALRSRPTPIPHRTLHLFASPLSGGPLQPIRATPCPSKHSGAQHPFVPDQHNALGQLANTHEVPYPAMQNLGDPITTAKRGERTSPAPSGPGRGAYQLAPLVVCQRNRSIRGWREKLSPWDHSMGGDSLIPGALARHECPAKRRGETHLYHQEDHMSRSSVVCTWIYWECLGPLFL